MAVQLRMEVDGQAVLDTAARGRPLAFIYGSRPSGGVTKGLEEAMATMNAGVCTAHWMVSTHAAHVCVLHIS